MDRRGWVHTIHSAPCGSLHFHTGTVCLSATDNAGTYALSWASKVVFCQPTASRAHACPTYRGVPDNTCLHGLQWQIVRSWHPRKMHRTSWNPILSMDTAVFSPKSLPCTLCTLNKSHLLTLDITCTMLKVLGIVPLHMEMQWYSVLDTALKKMPPLLQKKQ